MKSKYDITNLKSQKNPYAANLKQRTAVKPAVKTDAKAKSTDDSTDSDATVEAATAQDAPSQSYKDARQKLLAKAKSRSKK